MAKIDFPKKQEQRLIPKYLLEYSEELQKNHPDPSAEWGSSGSEYTAGNGIEINEDVISIDDTVVATKNDIPDVSEFITDDDLSQVLEDYELKSEAFSGSYNDLTDKPTIPTKTSDLQNDSGYITGVTWNEVTGKPTFATVATSGDYDDLIDKPDLSIYETKAEAFSGSYNDLTDKPTLFSGNYNDLTNKPDLSVYELKSEAFSGDYTDLTNKPDLSVYELKSEAFSGNYNDLTNKPTIPTVNNNTITITQGGVTKGSFTLNQNTNQTIALDAGGSGPGLQNNSITGLVTEATSGSNKPSISISDFTGTPTTYKLNLPEKNGTVATLDDIPTVPTKTSDLQNDSGFITGITSSMVTSALGYTPGTSNFSGDYNDLTNKPTIPVVPTDVSAFNNDAGYITSSALPTNYVTTDTNQNITGEKTFVGDKRIKFKQNTSSNKLGFTLYNRNNQEKGYLEYNPNNDSLCLGRYGTYGVAELGFLSQIQSNSSIQHKFLVPNVTLTASRTDYIPISVNGTRADSTGDITIAIPDVSNYVTINTTQTITGQKTFDPDLIVFSNNTYHDLSSALSDIDYAVTEVQNIPTTATSTSTVTPSTTQLVFTYTDNTTETITLMTGASVSTTTTLS